VAVAIWRKEEAPPLEAPEWYRNFHLEAWDEPDGWERGMMADCDGRACWPDAPEWRPGWPLFLHEQHAKRRWGEARYGYLQAHEAFAEQEFAEIRARRAERRSQV
jgi:hypothetical protein